MQTKSNFLLSPEVTMDHNTESLEHEERGHSKDFFLNISYELAKSFLIVVYRSRQILWPRSTSVSQRY